MKLETNEVNASTDCPSWCEREHVTDVSSDQIHQGRLDSVPVVALNRSFPKGGAFSRSVEATEAVVFAYQYVDDTEMWIAIVEEESQQQCLEISLESARRLHRCLTALLNLVK